MSDDKLVERPYGEGFLRFACPGDEQDAPTWILRFADPDCREQVFTGEQAEHDAWAAWNRYAPSYNCWLFRPAALQSERASMEGEIERLREALTPFARHYEVNDCAEMDDETWRGNLEVPISDLKRAYDALTSSKTGDE